MKSISIIVLQSAPESVPQPALTSDAREKNSRKRLSSRLRNSRKQMWTATIARLGPAWRAKAIR